jgi:Xaa-Pro dipeptidase
MATPRERRARVASRLKEAGIFAVVLEDFESQRSMSLRYLSGHPSDAILVIFSDGRSVLVPWDMAMAEAKADADRIVPYTRFRRSFAEAVSAVLKENGLEAGADRTVEVSGRTPHPRYLELCSTLSGTKVICEENGIDSFLSGMRTIKDEDEIASLGKAASITNEVIRRVEAFLTSHPHPTEIEVAQTVERDAFSLGAEGLGFETLAAGPARSWGIHAFPPYSGGPFGGPGLSILDFGVKVDGYTSDVTLTIARGKLSRAAGIMVDLVETAYKEAIAACQTGASPQEPAKRVDALFESRGMKMPHSLGHGIGLDAHEGPLIRSGGAPSDPALMPGMAFTIEPGLYDPAHGGVRLENDVLVTQEGAKILTQAGIIRLP